MTFQFYHLITVDMRMVLKNDINFITVK